MTRIREAGDGDLDEVLRVERAAFGQDSEADLVRSLLGDASARPLLSLLAFEDDQAVGHVLFTAVRLNEDEVRASILAPLAVVPEYQGKGIGSQLVKSGLQLLSESGMDLVFVLGDPEYYRRFGFQPAGRLGLNAPYPIPANHVDAWMVLSLHENVIGAVSGTIACADSLNKLEYWVE